MEKLKPKLFSVMKTYTKQQCIKDIIAGIIVAIIALPLSIALAIASGVNPEQGLYTAIIAGFCISFFGGSRVQIGGPTAAFVVIIYGIVAKYGMSGLTLATLMAGIILIIMGLCRFGSLIRFIPYTITTGFTSGIAIGIFVGQLKDFFGLKLESVPSEFIEKMIAYGKNFHTLNPHALLIGCIALAILIIWPIIAEKTGSSIMNIIPASLISIIVTTLMVKFLPFDVKTIGDLYTISNKLPTPVLPQFELSTAKELISPAFTIAILAGIESLLSCVVSDGMVGSKHRSNMELIAQGIGNVCSSLFGGIPATGAIARTAANVKNGGRTPIAGMVHAITLLLILVILMPLASLIPMPTLAAVLIMVAYNMSEWRVFVKLVKSSPKSDILVLVTTFLLTVIFDLVVAIEVGILMAAILFMKRMADVTQMKSWTYIEEDDDENDPDNINLKTVPKNVGVYEIVGPMFFAAADKVLDVTTSERGKMKAVIIRMRGVPAMDATAIHTFEDLLATCKKKNITLIFSHVQEQPLSVMKKSGFYESVGGNNFRPNIDDALAYAEQI